MATIANQYDPNDPNKEINTGGGGEVIQTGSSASPEGGGASSQSRVPSSNTPNIQQYLAANQGAGEQLTEGITKNVQNQANQVNQGVTSAQNKLNKQYQPLQQGLAGGQELVNSAFKDPQKLLNEYNAAKIQSSSQPLSSEQQSSANRYNEFQKLNTGGYNPDISVYSQTGQDQLGQIQGQLQNFNQNVPSAINEAGRFQLLQKAVGQPNYNQGQQTLDSLFLQGQPGGAKQLQQNISNIRNDTRQGVNAAGADVANKLQALQGLSGQNQEYIKNLFTQGNPNQSGMGLNQIGENVKNEYAQAQANANNIQGGLANAFSTKNFTPEQLAQLNLAPGTHTWGLSGQDLMNAGHYAANPLQAAEQGGYAQTASPEEFARYNALNQLAGGPAGTAQSSIFGGAQTAGGYQPVSFDSKALQDILGEKQKTITQTDFQNALRQTLGNFNMNVPGPASGSPIGVGTNPFGIITDAGGGVGSAPGSAPTGGVSVPIAQKLQQAMASGALTPDQAREIIRQGTSDIQKQYGSSTADVEQSFLPFLNYYNKEYSPAYADILGERNPDATPLPADWSSITRPQGK